MKKIFFISLMLTAFSSFIKAQDQAPLSAEKIFEDAVAQAKKENKCIMVIFHASWCTWCHRMDASLNDEKCKKFFDDNYIIRHLVVDESKDKKNLENPGANEFRAKYHGDGTDTGIPFWLVFSRTGKLVSDSKIRKEGDGPEGGQNVGCPANEQEVAFFLNVVKQTAKLNADQLETIRKRFRENDK